MGELSDSELAALHADAVEFGGSEWDRWAAVAGILGLDPGPAPRLHDEEELEVVETGEA